MDLNNQQSISSDLNLSGIVDILEEHIETNIVQQMDGPSSINGQRTSPYITIIEQPAPKALRFRYECEGRSAGSIPGVNSTADNKTYPTIKIVGYKGRAVIVVSCVTKDSPHKPHPHNLVGRDNCKKGICTIEIDSESMTASFQNLGIQCVKRKDIDEALRVREEIRVDPFRTGFQHKDNPTSIDLNAVRLCFQAFLGGDTIKGKYSILKPIVSDPIFDKKAMSDLTIARLSDSSASVRGGREIILLCEKVIKDDIKVRFYEKNENNECIWEDFADFQPSDVHKQVAIWFKTPAYKRKIPYGGRVNAWIQLIRPSDGAISEPRQFTFIPDDSDVESKRKRQKFPCDLLNQLQSGDPSLMAQSNFIDQPSIIPVPIKKEPETSPNPYSSNLYLPSPHNSRTTPSPHEDRFPNANSNSSYGHLSLLDTNIHLSIGTNRGSISDCTTTNVCTTDNSHNSTSQQNYSLQTNVPTTTSPYLTGDNNESNLMENTFPSTHPDICTLWENPERMSEETLIAGLYLTDNRVCEEFDQEIVPDNIPDNINMSDSLDRIANHTLKEFCEHYTDPN